MKKQTSHFGVEERVLFAFNSPDNWGQKSLQEELSSPKNQETVFLDEGADSQSPEQIRAEFDRLMNEQNEVDKKEGKLVDKDTYISGRLKAEKEHPFHQNNSVESGGPQIAQKVDTLNTKDATSADGEVVETQKLQVGKEQGVVYGGQSGNILDTKNRPDEYINRNYAKLKTDNTKEGNFSLASNKEVNEKISETAA